MQSITSTTIRAAQATASDAATVVALINMASHDLLRDMIGNDYPAQATRWILRDDNLFSHRFMHIVESGGEIMAVLSAYGGADKARLNGATNELLAASASPAGLARFDQLEPLLTWIDRLPRDAWYVQFLAVKPAARRNGIAGDLLRLAERQARKAGAATIELDVETGNAPALNVYQRHGLVVAGTSETVYFEPQQRSIAFHRMVKDLTTS